MCFPKLRTQNHLMRRNYHRQPKLFGSFSKWSTTETPQIRYVNPHPTMGPASSFIIPPSQTTKPRNYTHIPTLLSNNSSFLDYRQASSCKISTLHKITLTPRTLSQHNLMNHIDLTWEQPSDRTITASLSLSDEKMSLIPIRLSPTDQTVLRVLSWPLQGSTTRLDRPRALVLVIRPPSTLDHEPTFTLTSRPRFPPTNQIPSIHRSTA